LAPVRQIRKRVGMPKARIMIVEDEVVVATHLRAGLPQPNRSGKFWPTSLRLLQKGIICFIRPGIIQNVIGKL